MITTQALSMTTQLSKLNIRALQDKEGRIFMSKETYNYKRTAITTARDLCYSDEVIMQIHNAKTENEISRIMRDARLKEV